MPLVMSPVSVFQQLFKLDRKTALVLVTGMAVIAVGVVVRSWQVPTGSAGLIGLYVVALGLLLGLVSAIINTKWLREILAAIIAFMLVAVIVGFAVAVFFRPSSIQPPWCLAKFWLPCEVVVRNILRENDAELTADSNVPAIIAIPTVTAAPLPQPQPTRAPLPQPLPNSSTQPVPSPSRTPQPSEPSTAKVYIHFAGLITRNSITQLNQALRRGGWRVEGSSGERLTQAAGLNEVRYGDAADRAAAEALALAVSGTSITSRSVTAKQMPAVAPNLELWISN